ncbi:MAG: sulfate adenylyltransferase [Thermoplasmata archaeon]|nr:MAG: sulfate adenylyltransferase [Thermoplasmata archaeon]
MVAPHGGKLVERLDFDEKKREEAYEMPRKTIGIDEARDAANIAHGVFSPLEGYMCREDLEHVLEHGRLANDLPWTIPIIMDVSKEEIKDIIEGDELALFYGEMPIAIMNVEEIYPYDKKVYAESVFGTLSAEHPGVSNIMAKKEHLIGGRITLLNDPPTDFQRYKLWPKETRVLFKERGWKSVVGFQTRNAPHAGHEYVQKTALTFVDGLFVNPLIGRKKSGDFKDEVIISAYEALFKHYYPKDTAVLAILETEMRYAGPKEAIFHAIIRKNFGCTHFIVGRDHAGVGKFYGPYDAQEIFYEYPDLGITPLFFRSFFYCKKCGGVVNEKICPHGTEHHINFSGTKIRAMLASGNKPPPIMMRPEVADAILEYEEPFVG